MVDNFNIIKNISNEHQFYDCLITFARYIKIHLNVKPTEPRGNGGEMMRA
jgi:hypothetical protein